MSIRTQIKKAEERLGVGSEPTIIEVVIWSSKDHPLPPETRYGNLITRCVYYEDVREREGVEPDDFGSIEDED